MPSPTLVDALRSRQGLLAQGLVDRQYALQPELAGRYGAAGRQRCEEDAKYHLRMLAESMAVACPELFLDYIAWAGVMLDRRGIPVNDLAQHLAVLRELLRDELGVPLAQPALALIDASGGALPATPREPASFMDEQAALAPLAREFLDLTLGGQRALACQRVAAAAAEGASTASIYLEVFQRCQREIGRLWQTNQISVAQEHHVSAVTQLAMAQLYSPVVLDASRRTGKAVATCAAGDLHEIGLHMVSDLLEQDGWDVTFLGANTPALAVRQMLVDRQAGLLLVSASLALHLTAVRSLIDLVRADAACGQVKILVGGYPFNLAPGLWRQMGADGHASDALQAATLARSLQPADGP